MSFRTGATAAALSLFALAITLSAQAPPQPLHSRRTMIFLSSPAGRGGHAQAQFALANRYFHDIDVAQDYGQSSALVS